mmetsp:Transcript_17787/g.62747  ORF Transcript_17787/g.62747 Transcript_17787/m.62747 type:complete len:267 (+) Transcript_17787:193-993(+)
MSSRSCIWNALNLPVTVSLTGSVSTMKAAWSRWPPRACWISSGILMLLVAPEPHVLSMACVSVIWLLGFNSRRTSRPPAPATAFGCGRTSWTAISTSPAKTVSPDNVPLRSPPAVSFSDALSASSMVLCPTLIEYGSLVPAMLKAPPSSRSMSAFRASGSWCCPMSTLARAMSSNRGEPDALTTNVALSVTWSPSGRLSGSCPSSVADDADLNDSAAVIVTPSGAVHFPAACMCALSWCSGITPATVTPCEARMTPSGTAVVGILK